MASKVPKFGAWEGGQNFTVYFDNARKTKSNGQKINPNDPEDNPEMFEQNGGTGQAAAVGPSQSRPADKQRKPTKVPHFGAWEEGDSAGYTATFEHARKTKNNGLLDTVDNEPQMNRDMPHRAQAQTRPVQAAQTRPAQTKPEVKEASSRPKVPQFGDWEGEGGGGYTAVFDSLKKKNDVNSNNTPEINRDVAPRPQEARVKVPRFGAWEGGEAVQYTAVFDNAVKTKNSRPGIIPTEPQLNRDVGDKGRPPPPATKARPESREDYGLRNASRTSASSISGSESARQGKQPSASQSPLHPKGKLQPKTGGSRGNQAASIPQFGGWNSDPAQAEGYTTAFARAKEERNTPQHSNAPPSYHQQSRYNDQKQPSCCTIL